MAPMSSVSLTSITIVALFSSATSPIWWLEIRSIILFCWFLVRRLFVQLLLFLVGLGLGFSVLGFV